MDYFYTDVVNYDDFEKLEFLKTILNHVLVWREDTK